MRYATILIQMVSHFVALLGLLESRRRGHILTGRIAAFLGATLKGQMLINRTYCVMDGNSHENEWSYELFN